MQIVGEAEMPIDDYRHSPKKYEFTDETITIQGRELHRIRSLARPYIYGGFIESESNLSHDDNCWVGYNAIVYGEAVVLKNAIVEGWAIISGSAKICGNAKIYGQSQVSGRIRIGGFSRVYGNAKISGHCSMIANSRIFGNAQISGDAAHIRNSYIFDDAIIYGQCYISSSIICDYTKIFSSNIYNSKIWDHTVFSETTVKYSTVVDGKIIIHCRNCNCNIVKTTLDSYKHIEWNNTPSPLYHNVYDCENDKQFELNVYAGQPYCNTCIKQFL